MYIYIHISLDVSNLLSKINIKLTLTVIYSNLSKY